MQIEVRGLRRAVDSALEGMRPPPGPHLPLRLHDLIPPPVCTHVDFQPVLALRELLLIAPLGMAKSRQNVVKWHAATQDAFLITPDWAGEQPLCFSFYTDGSSAFLAQERLAASAVVLIVHAADGDRFGGFLCGHMFASMAA